MPITRRSAVKKAKVDVHLEEGSAKASSRGRSASAATSRTGRVPKNLRAEQTRERIVDCAEELFANLGYFGVTLKDISASAAVNTALVHYYFGNKQQLFEAVINRRAGVLNAVRCAALDDYAQRVGKDKTVEGVLDAFVSPMLDLARTGGSGWKNYFRLIAQADMAPGWGREVMNKFFDPLAQRLIDEIRQLVPNADERSLFWSLQMFSGALVVTLSNTGRIDRLSKGICRSADFESAKRGLISYAAAGFVGACAAKKIGKGGSAGTRRPKRA